jgi:fructose-specific component phosphotransferase system IIB-like protein
MPKSKRPEPDRALLDAFWREPVDRSVLPNGLTLIVKSDRSAALASVQVWVRTGSIHEGDQLGAGLSHYLEHMLFKGTARRTGREISATVQAHGGYINAYTTFDRTVYYIDLPSEQLEVAVDVLADAVLHSTLPEDEALREKDVILREIAMTQDDPDNRLWEALFSTAFREHPYRQPIIGHRDVFSAAGRDALLKLLPRALRAEQHGRRRRRRRRPRGGADAVERHFGGAPRSRLAPVLVPAEPLQLGPRAWSAAMRRWRSSGAPWPGRSPGSRTRRRPCSTSSPSSSEGATARSSGSRSAKSASSSTRSTPRAGTRARADSSASPSPATRASARRRRRPSCASWRPTRRPGPSRRRR